MAIAVRLASSIGGDDKQTFVSKDSSFQASISLNWVKHTGDKEYEEDLLLKYQNPTRKGRVIQIDSRAVIGITELKGYNEDDIELFMNTYIEAMEQQILKNMEKGKIEKQDINDNDKIYVTKFKGNVQGEKIAYKFGILKKKDRLFSILAYDDDETFSKVESDIDEVMTSLIPINKE